MEQILQQLKGIDLSWLNLEGIDLEALNLDIPALIRSGIVLIPGLLIVSLLSRFIFGKKSEMTSAISSAVGIVFLYAVIIAIQCSGISLKSLLGPLPYVTITSDRIVLFSFRDVHYTVLCSQVLSMVILAFLMNLADGWMPKGKHLITWLLFRCLTLAIALVLHGLVTWLFATFLPEGIVTYAPVILLAVLVLMLLTGALKIVVGLLLTTVNPLIAALYTFFFATILGKQISKAVLTTGIVSLLVYVLGYLGIGAISIASAALIAYIPLALLLLLVWYFVS